MLCNILYTWIVTAPCLPFNILSKYSIRFYSWNYPETGKSWRICTWLSMPLTSCTVHTIFYFQGPFPGKPLLAKPSQRWFMPVLKINYKGACQPQKHIKHNLAAAVISCFYVLYKNGKYPASRVI